MNETAARWWRFTTIETPLTSNKPQTQDVVTYKAPEFHNSRTNLAVNKKNDGTKRLTLASSIKLESLIGCETLANEIN